MIVGQTVGVLWFGGIVVGCGVGVVVTCVGFVVIEAGASVVGIGRCLVGGGVGPIVLSVGGAVG